MAEFARQGGSVNGVPAQLRELLHRALDPAALDIRDDSAHHAGHAGAGDGGHYAVTIVADGFTGRGLLERHRMVYDAAAPLLRRGIHALQISALTPAEAAARGMHRSIPKETVE